MPVFDVLLAHFAGEAAAVVAGRVILAGLREIFDIEFGDFENALGAVEAIGFR